MLPPFILKTGKAGPSPQTEQKSYTGMVYLIKAHIHLGNGLYLFGNCLKVSVNVGLLYEYVVVGSNPIPHIRIVVLH